MHYSIGKLLQGVDNFDALQCLGFTSFDALCMNNNLGSVVYFKSHSNDYFAKHSVTTIRLINFEAEAYKNYLQRIKK